MDEQLKRQIEERKQEAKRKNVGGKAQIIAKGFGEDISRTGITQFAYNGRGFQISSYSNPDGDIRTQMQIHFKDKEVYTKTNGKLEHYIPGAWEEPFN